jgi:hypothetical protein
MAGVIGSAATTATTTATMAERAAQCVNGMLKSHMDVISAATNAGAIGVNTETLVHWGKRNILAGLSILKPFFGNGNTMSELWVRNIDQQGTQRKFCGEVMGFYSKDLGPNPGSRDQDDDPLSLDKQAFDFK